MVDILHKVGIKAASPDSTYRALATREGLCGWWTKDVQWDGEAGSRLHFRFGDRGFIDVKVMKLDAAKRVVWEVVDGPGAWIGTEIIFELRQDGDFTTVLFKHQGWKEPVEFMHACSTKWATFLMSLKALVETGKGAAYPNDIHIGNGD